MKTPSFISALLLASAAATWAQAPAATPAPPKRSMLKYSAPKGASEGSRIDGDGGSRGTADKDKLPSLYVLAPNHEALTSQAQPTLFWFQTAGSDKRFELTVVEPKNPRPILKMAAPKSERAGVHRVSLAKQNISLKPGVTYKWSVAWVPDANNRSLNVIAGGAIKYLPAEEKVAAAMAEKQGPELAVAYAQNGFWYDALEAISNALEAAPQDKELRRLRADLFEQAGLKDAATFERK